MSAHVDTGATVCCWSGIAVARFRERRDRALQNESAQDRHQDHNGSVRVGSRLRVDGDHRPDNKSDPASDRNEYQGSDYIADDPSCRCHNRLQSSRKRIVRQAGGNGSFPIENTKCDRQLWTSPRSKAYPAQLLRALRSELAGLKNNTTFGSISHQIEIRGTYEK